MDLNTLGPYTLGGKECSSRGKQKKAKRVRQHRFQPHMGHRAAASVTSGKHLPDSFDLTPPSFLLNGLERFFNRVVIVSCKMGSVWPSFKKDCEATIAKLEKRNKELFHKELRFRELRVL